MGDYIKTILLLLLSGAILVFALTLGLAIFAVAAVVIPILYWWYRRKIIRGMEDINKRHPYSGAKIIEAEYEIIEEEDSNHKD